MMRTAMVQSCERGERAFVLLTVLIVVMLSSMVAVSLLYSLRADVAAQTAGTEQEQGWSVALSGVTRAIALARSSVATGQPVWENNPAALQNQFVVKDGDDNWYFSVYSASESFGTELRFGLTDEAGKFSVYHTDPAWLAPLPHLDATLAQFLVQGTPATNGLGITNRVDTSEASESDSLSINELEDLTNIHQPTGCGRLNDRRRNDVGCGRSSLFA